MSKSIKISLFVLSLLFLSQSPLFAHRGNVLILRAEGESTIKRGNQEMPAVVGVPCKVGDVFTVKPDSFMDIAINNAVGCRLLAESKCEIIETAENSMSLKIREGNAILNLKTLPAESTFKVETPTAVASVRGTQFWGRVMPGEKNRPVTTFAVRQGEVEILAKTAKQIFILKPGEALDIPDRDRNPYVREALPEEMKAMEQADQISL